MLLLGFIFVNIFESLGMGVGVAFLVTQWNNMKSHPWVLASIFWLLASWWPHDNMHRVGGHEGFGYLLGLELGFHVTIIIAGFILANFAVKTIGNRQQIA